MTTHVVSMALTLAIFSHRFEASFINWEHFFGNASTENFQVYWNVPTFMCHRYGMRFEEISRDFGIIQNAEDEFDGEKMVILYHPGLFPSLTRHPNGTQTKKNGGVPQKGDLSLHLQHFKQDLIQKIPNESFAGVGVIDFESWRPIFRQNWGSLNLYRIESRNIVKKAHPTWPDQRIQRKAIADFETSAKLFMQETLMTVKSLRPQATWGYYSYPYCFNLTPKNPQLHCDKQNIIDNNNLAWLFNSVDVLLPSVHLQSFFTEKERVWLINGKVSEAMRISRASSSRTKVLPYFWYKYQDNKDVFVSKNDIVNGFHEIGKLSADGVIIWGSSNDLNSAAKCQKCRDYFQNVLGPAVIEARAMLKKRLSDDEGCETVRPNVVTP